MTSPRRDASTLSLTDEALTLQAQRERLVASLHDRPEALKRPWLELTRLTEAWLRSALERHLKPVGVPWRALLLGSFARREPALHSDLDLLLEVQEPEALSHPQLAEAVTALLDEARAMRLRLSHVVRSPAHHDEPMREDWRSAVALLDARELDLDPRRSSSPLPSARALDFLRAEDQGVAFTERLIEAHLKRRERFEQSVYWLEPDLKSGLGALRDIQTLSWAAQVRARQPLQELDFHQAPWLDTWERSRHWMLTLRMHLHSLHARPQERLHFEAQRAIALRLGLDVEALMREHYMHTRASLAVLDRALRHWGSQARRALTLHWAPGALCHETTLSPQSCFEALRHSSRQGLMLGPALERQIIASVERWDEALCESERTQRGLLKMVLDPLEEPLTSTRLLDLGLLAKLLPEFEPIVCHVQHDTYHVYTTDVHTLKCLERARSLCHHPERDAACRRWPAFASIASRLEDREMLLMAALLHDIGKNRGGGHSERGAALIPRIAARWRLDPARSQTLELLVREHLALSNTSRRRDLNDPAVIASLAETLESTERLRLLTCLTFCDMSTVSPTAMNEWRSSLLLRLHAQLEAVLSAEQRPHDQARELLKRALRERPGGDGRGALGSIERFFDALPASRLEGLQAEALAALYDAELATRHDPSRSFVTLQAPRDSAHATRRLIVATRDRPGALATIAGVLSALGLTILAAEIFSSSDQRALDLFYVQRVHHGAGPGAPLISEALAARLEATLLAALDEGVAIEGMLKKRQRYHSADRALRLEPDEVRHHPEASQECDVIEVRCPDRPGLLHDVARTFHAHGVTIRSSKLDLEGHRAIDTFYLHHHEYGKLPPERLEALTRDLLAALAP